MNIRKGIRLFIRSLVLSLILVLSNPSLASDLLLILSDNQSIHNEIATLILKRSNQTGRIVLHQEFAVNEAQETVNLLIAIGTRACDTVLQKKTRQDTLICTLIPAQTYISLLNKYNKTILDNTTAVYMDQPIYRQIALARLIAPNATNIATIFGQTSVFHRDDFEKTAEKAGFITHYAFLDEVQNPVQILTPLIQRSDIFIAIPDSANFNRSVSRWALYITLRNKIPLIGFSSSYSQAGATVSIFTTTEQLANQTIDVLNRFQDTQNLTPPEFPNDFTVEVNHSTVRTLGLNLPNSQALRQQLKEIHQ